MTQGKRQRRGVLDVLPPVTRTADEIRTTLRGKVAFALKARNHFQKCCYAALRDPSKLNVGKRLLSTLQNAALRLETANQAVITEKTTLTRLMKQISDEEAIALKSTEKLMGEVFTTEVEDENSMA